MQYRPAGIHCKFFGHQIDDTELLKGIGQRIEQRPLLPDVVGDVGPGHADFVQPLIDQEYDHIFSIDMSLLVFQ